LTSSQSSVAAESAVSADVSTEKPTSTTAAVTTKKRTSQAELLAGAVKRKRYFTITDTVKPLMLVCPLFCEHNKTAKLKGANINCRPK